MQPYKVCPANLTAVKKNRTTLSAYSTARNVRG